MHHHQRPVLDAGLAGVVELVAVTADLELGGSYGDLSKHF